MDIGKIMTELKENYIWVDREHEGPALNPCMFCGSEANIIVRTPLYGLCGATVRCRSCGACGPSASIHALILKPGKLCTPLLPESLERGIMAAVDTWNSGAVGNTHLGNMRIEAPV